MFVYFEERETKTKLLTNGFYRIPFISSHCKKQKITKSWNCAVQRLNIDISPRNSNLYLYYV